MPTTEKKKIVSITSNKKAFFDYEVLEQWEAGIKLHGYELPSLRKWQVNLKGAFIGFQWRELFLKWCLISPPNSLLKRSPLDSKIERKIFLHRKTIDYLTTKTKEPGKTMVPLEIYFSWSLVKIKIALVQGKKQHDKKQKLKEKAMDKQAKIQMKSIEY
jgi:SsrA-binding protein